MPFHEIGMLVIVSVVAVPTLLNRFLKTVFLILAKGLRPLDRKPDSNPGYKPRVSIQVPISNEPPEVVLTTLESLARLDYPRLLVQVIDNNTLDDQLWRPVEAFCQNNQVRFSFYHVERLSGYKAGALDYALQKTPSDVELIAIVDADNIVEVDFLRHTVPFFADPRVAVVQTPLGFRDPLRGAGFPAWIFLIYRYYLSIYMPACSRIRSAPFIGGMGIVRRSALETVGGWDGMYLTEDMDLSYRLFSEGYLSHFIDVFYGKSMPPGDFSGFMKQHFRWNFGNAQIFRDRLPTLVTKKWGGRGGWLKRLFYFTCPGIYINLYFLPFSALVILIRLGEAFGQTEPLCDWLCGTMLCLLSIELCGEALMFAALGWSERAGLLGTLKNYIAWWSLSLNNSLSTWAVLFQKTRPFEITDKKKSCGNPSVNHASFEFVFAVLAACLSLAPIVFDAAPFTPAAATLLLIAMIGSAAPIIAVLER